MKKITFYLIIALLSAFGASICFIATPYYLGLAIDQMGISLAEVSQLLLTALGLYVFYALLSMISQYTSSKAGVIYTTRIREQLIARIQSVSLAYLDTQAHGEILSVFTNDSQLFQDGLVQFITTGFQGIFTVIIAAVFMFKIDVSLTLIVFISVPVIMATSYLVNKVSRKRFNHQQALKGQLNEEISQYVENDEYIFTNAYEEVLFQRFEKSNEHLDDISEKAQFIGALVNPTTRLVNNLSYMLIGLLGSFIVLEKGISIGVLTSFISYSVMFSKPLNEFSAVFTDVSLGMVAFQRIQNLLKMPLQKMGGENLALNGDTITMKNVNFSYTKSIPAIEGLDLKIEPLSKVAIVGPTGSGKSTLINILLRFYDIDSGTFLIDDRDVEGLSLESVRSVMGVVMQEPWLFRGTILDNLRYGNEHQSIEAIEEMCKNIGCYDFIMSLDEGFNSMVGSISMSQGQKQMITIVRALLTQAPILLLDEATSNIDVVSENIIQKTLTQLMDTHTSFFVAHRLQTITNSDLILVMNQGKLVETGTHASLMAKNGFYADLVRAQNV